MDNLKKLRENAELSHQALAKAVGSTQQKIYSYENGIYEPDIKTLKLLANFFGTSIDYLVGNADILSKPERVEQFDLNEEEADVVTKYRSLKKNGRESLRLILNSLLKH